MLKNDTVAYYPAKLSNTHAAGALPEGRRTPRGWNAVRVDKDDGLVLDWKKNAPFMDWQSAGEGRLRISAALDYREAGQVEVFLGRSGERIGSFDIRYAYTFQPFELVLDGERTAAVVREGVVLRTNGEGRPLWIFDELQGDEARQLFAPHLLIGRSERRMELFLHSIASLSSLQPFGWLEGCVLDGLYALRQTVGGERIDLAIAKHLEQYFSEDGRLLYEDLHGKVADDKLTTIEATLPLAVIAKLRVDHPFVMRAISFWESRSVAGGGAIVDGDTVTAEGAYTVAYPLAVIASRLKREDLAEQAISEILLRRDALTSGEHLFLRYNRKMGAHVFRNWSRAYAWYMLGMTKAWHELKHAAFGHLPALGEVEREIRRIADVALRWVRPEGLWTAFLDEPGTGAETSGSAGIAAALALGAGYGLLDRHHEDAAARTFAALQPYLTPDGILSGVTQHNAGGIELQRCGYRVLSQMGMGLMAQLYAALHEFKRA
ncbi:glycoside hydrolase family 88 protein [Paenibacillus hodogayensis]|uniref:Glycoside hydrolase family 88 protein n=1 Tax=Paenibacillus hodogayensis TaxID=279208 RepID=A0ABV5VPZ8_9BACL